MKMKYSAVSKKEFAETEFGGIVDVLREAAGWIESYAGEIVVTEVEIKGYYTGKKDAHSNYEWVVTVDFENRKEKKNA